MSELLLVEDEESVSTPLAELLRREGYSVRVAATAGEAASALGPETELVLLDWMLPDRPGLDLLREWRRDGLEIPVIFVTARDDLVDRVVGLEVGADDYVTKPFQARELVARIRARLRRSAAEPSLRAAGLVLDPARHEATYEARALTLTRMEFKLLALLVGAPGRVFTREEILNQVWGYERYPTTRTVDTHVLQLRQKTRAELIETVRGVGYRLVRPS